MNICIKKYKVFIISLCLVSMFSFNFCQLRAYAVVGADDAVVIGGVTVTGGMVAYAVGALVIAGGATIYANTDSTDIKYIADGMIQTGEATKAFGVQTLATGEKVLTWTADGLSYVKSKIADMISANTFPASFSSSSVTLSDLKATSTGSITLVSGINVPANSVVTFRAVQDGVVQGLSTFKVTTAITNGSIVASLNMTKTSFSISIFRGCATIGFTSTLATSLGLTDFVINGNSVCVDTPVSDSLKTWNPTTASDVIGSGSTASDGSVSYQPKIGFPLTDSGSTTADGAPVYAPTADIPFGKTWDDVPTVSIPTDSTSNPSIPTTGDTTGTIDTGKGILDIPILGDILRVLQKILDFLGTLIGSLVTALINALEQLLTKLFVPTADMFNDFYSDIESNVKSKFPYSMSILNSLKVNADEFKDIHVTIWGHDCVIVSAQFVNDNISWIRVVTSCFWIFSLFVYVWRKINAVLNGGDVNSTTVYAPGGGGSGPPSVI